MNEIATVNTTLNVFEPDTLLPRFIAYIDRTPATARTYIINLRQFFLYLRTTRTERPTRDDIIAYRHWLSTDHAAIEEAPDALDGWRYRTDRAGNIIRVTCKPNTVKQYLQSVRQFFSWTAAEGIYPNIAANIHAPKVKTEAHRKEALTPAEVLTIETSISTNRVKRNLEAGAAAKDRDGRVQRSNEQ